MHIRLAVAKFREGWAAKRPWGHQLFFICIFFKIQNSLGVTSECFPMGWQRGVLKCLHWELLNRHGLRLGSEARGGVET